MDNIFEINGSSFIGVATDQPLAEKKLILATAVTTVTATFYPVRFNNEAVGTGNGVLTAFTLDNATVQEGVEVYVDGILQILDVDYTINLITGAITFTSPPAIDSVITANYYGTTTKVWSMVAGQTIRIAGLCTGVTSTATIALS